MYMTLQDVSNGIQNKNISGNSYSQETIIFSNNFYAFFVKDGKGVFPEVVNVSPAHRFRSSGSTGADVSIDLFTIQVIVAQ